jgi:DivIVA domain-containing protein
VEIGSKEVREVEFRERMRGYHQDDVDEFLEQVARGIEVLEAKVKEAEQRAAELSARRGTVQVQPAVAERPAPLAADDTIQRTLLLAQRTADQLLADARAEAEELIGQARDRSSQIIDEARSRASALVEEKARLVASEVDALEARRSDLLRELAHIAEVTNSSRLSLKDNLNELVRSLDSALVFDYPAFEHSDESATYGERTQERRPSPDRETLASASAETWLSDSGDEDSAGSFARFDEEEGSEIDESDRTMVFPSPQSATRDESADITFGRPNFQLLDGDAPSNPVLFDDESQF